MFFQIDFLLKQERHASDLFLFWAYYNVSGNLFKCKCN